MCIRDSDIFSTVISVPGLEIGLIEINITATDKFGISTVGTGQIEVVNQAPRLTSVEMSPSVGYRGTILVVNAEAYDGHGVGNVSVDLRSYGGELFYLTDNAGVWTGQITIPQGMPPGYQSVEFILQDGAGKVGTTSIWYQDQPDSQDPRGPHYISDEIAVPIEVRVLNSAPEIIPPENKIITRSDSSIIEILEVQIIDADGILNARADLGVFAPLGNDGIWLKMYDDGTNGDRVANDGIFTVQLSVRSSTPLGAHEVLIQASDNYDVVTSQVPVLITVEDQTSSVPGLDDTAVSPEMLMGIFSVLVFGIIIVSAILLRNKDDDDGGGDRFGFE